MKKVKIHKPLKVNNLNYRNVDYEIHSRSFSRFDSITNLRFVE